MGRGGLNLIGGGGAKVKLPKNRTSDHLLTLRTLIDKYVHCHGEKVYVCFVDFRKALDSVWHDGVLYLLHPL